MSASSCSLLFDYIEVKGRKWAGQEKQMAAPFGRSHGMQRVFTLPHSGTQRASQCSLVTAKCSSSSSQSQPHISWPGCTLISCCWSKCCQSLPHACTLKPWLESAHAQVHAYVCMRVCMSRHLLISSTPELLSHNSEETLSVPTYWEHHSFCLSLSNCLQTLQQFLHEQVRTNRYKSHIPKELDTNPWYHMW